jgi:hypothetical protein
MTEERVRLTVRLTVDLTSEEAELVKLLLLALKKEVAEKGSIKLGSTTVPNDLLRKLLPRIKSTSL